MGEATYWLGKASKIAHFMIGSSTQSWGMPNIVRAGAAVAVQLMFWCSWCQSCGMGRCKRCRCMVQDADKGVLALVLLFLNRSKRLLAVSFSVDGSGVGASPTQFVWTGS